MALEPIFNEPHPDSFDNYILKIDNPYNSSTWTHPDLAIEIILRKASDGSIVASDTQASGIFNLGHLENGDYTIYMYIVSSVIPPPNDKSKALTHTFTISGSPHGPAPKTPATELIVGFHDPGTIPEGETREILSAISGGTPPYTVEWYGPGVTGPNNKLDVDYKFDIIPKEVIRLTVEDDKGVKKVYIGSVEVTTDSSSSETSSGTVIAEGGAGGAGGSAEGGAAEVGAISIGDVSGGSVGDVSAKVGDITFSPEITVNPEFILNFDGLKLAEGFFKVIGSSISSDELLNERLDQIQRIIAAELKDMQKLIFLLTNKTNKDKLEDKQVDKIYNTLKTEVLKLLNVIIIELKNFAKQNETELNEYKELITSLSEIVLNVNILNENILIEKIMPADWDEKLFEKYGKKALFKTYKSAVNGLNKAIRMHNKHIVEAKNLIAKITPENLAELKRHQTIIPGLITETHNIVTQLENIIAELVGDLSADELESEFTKILGLLSGDLTLIKAEKNKIDALKSEFEKLHNELINTKHKLREKGKWKSHGLKDWFGRHEASLEDRANAVQVKEDELRAILQGSKPVEPFKLTEDAQKEFNTFINSAELLILDYTEKHNILTAHNKMLKNRRALISNISKRKIIKFDFERYDNAILKLSEKPRWSSTQDMINYFEEKRNELNYAREETESILKVLSTEGGRGNKISQEQEQALTAMLDLIAQAMTALYTFAEKANIYNQ